MSIVDAVLTGVNLHKIARSGDEKPLHSTLELSELFRHCRLATPPSSIRYLDFSPLEAAEVWHPHCFIEWVERRTDSCLFALSGPGNKKFSGWPVA
jgi:hypothetical protein